MNSESTFHAANVAFSGGSGSARAERFMALGRVFAVTSQGVGLCRMR